MALSLFLSEKRKRNESFFFFPDAHSSHQPSHHAPLLLRLPLVGPVAHSCLIAAVLSLRFALLFDFILLGHEIIKCPIVVRKELKEMTTKIVSIIEMNQFKTGSRCRIPFDVHYVRKRIIDSKGRRGQSSRVFCFENRTDGGHRT